MNKTKHDKLHNGSIAAGVPYEQQHLSINNGFIKLETNFYALLKELSIFACEFVGLIFRFEILFRSNIRKIN